MERKQDLSVVAPFSGPGFPEIWGGLECTINRVGENFIDQWELSDHYNRSNFIPLIHNLGIRTLRFPILWERHQPTRDHFPDWQLTKGLLDQLELYRIKPIVGLVHHGSGPKYTQLDHASFANGLAEFAGSVARQFPNLEYYTPVNEPLTTARFSGLYGHWFPHAKNDNSFGVMLLNQLRGVVLAMKAVRKINPEAKLVQTEDLSKTFAFEGLQYQADFENIRRWLTFDLLCGRVDRHHPLWDYLIYIGLDERSLLFFRDHPTPPDILGLNYYITSERFLDDRIGLYPKYMYGGNGRHAYVDTEAIRIPHGQPAGLLHLLREVNSRYQMPMALTEIHLHCTREEQMRWFSECLETCKVLNLEGIAVKAITAWSLFGAFGWNKLLSSSVEEYEPGAYDLRSPAPRPTALAKLIRCSASTNNYDHPLLHQKGWWHREDRFTELLPPTPNGRSVNWQIGRPLLILSGPTVLGDAYARVARIRNIPYYLMPGGDQHTLTEAISKYKPWAIINTFEFAEVDAAEDIEEYYQQNVRWPEFLARIAIPNNIRLMCFSSDMVFTGSGNVPCTEWDIPAPSNVYGESKLMQELLVFDANPDVLMIRTGFLLNPWNATQVSSNARYFAETANISCSTSPNVSLTYVPDLVNVSLDLLIDDEKGIWHLVNEGSVLLHRLKSLLQSSEQPADSERFSLAPVGPNVSSRPFAVLASRKAGLLPSAEFALERYAQNYIPPTNVDTLLQSIG